MKKLIMTAVLLISIGTVSNIFAQQDPAARAAAMKQRLKDELKFTDAQADSVTAIQQEYRPKMREIYQDQSMSQEDKMTKVKPITDEQNKRIQSALGDDAYKKYQDWWQKNRPQRPPGGGGGGGTGAAPNQ